MMYESHSKRSPKTLVDGQEKNPTGIFHDRAVLVFGGGRIQLTSDHKTLVICCIQGIRLLLNRKGVPSA